MIQTCAACFPEIIDNFPLYYSPARGQLSSEKNFPTHFSGEGAHTEQSLHFSLETVPIKSSNRCYCVLDGASVTSVAIPNIAGGLNDAVRSLPGMTMGTCRQTLCVGNTSCQSTISFL